MAYNDYIRRERDRAAHNAVARAMGAAKRTACALMEEDKRVDAAIGVDGIARALDTAFGALDARADMVREAADNAARVAKPATAAHMTREIRENAVACKYADHRDVTGALHAPKMRVRRQGGGAPSDVCGPRMASPGVGAEQTIASRAVACAQLRTDIRTFRTCKGSIKVAAHNRILACLHTWEGDTEITRTARECGWT